MQLAVIGELSKRLSDEFKKRVSLPWKQIAGFRDRAVHDYYQLDLDQQPVAKVTQAALRALGPITQSPHSQ